MIDYKIMTFLTLCTELNYRKTAEKLNMTQPAVTNQIHSLEDYYNMKLFEYKNRVLYKTKHAELLENYCRSLMSNEQSFLKSLKHIEKPKLTIGATKTIGDCCLNDSIANLISSENIDLTIKVENTEVLLKLLNENKIDFAVIEGNFNKSDYEHITIKKEKLVGICSKNHEFSGKTIDITDLFTKRLIIREQGSGTRDVFEKVLYSLNYSVSNFKDIICINSFPLILNLVKSDVGVSFVYETIPLTSDDLSTFSIKDFTPRHEFNLVYLKNTKSSKYISYFI